MFSSTKHAPLAQSAERTAFNRVVGVRAPRGVSFCLLFSCLSKEFLALPVRRTAGHLRRRCSRWAARGQRRDIRLGVIRRTLEFELHFAYFLLSQLKIQSPGQSSQASTT